MQSFPVTTKAVSSNLEEIEDTKGVFRTTQWPTENGQKRSTKYTHKTKDKKIK